MGHLPVASLRSSLGLVAALALVSACTPSSPVAVAGGIPFRLTVERMAEGAAAPSASAHAVVGGPATAPADAMRPGAPSPSMSPEAGGGRDERFTGEVRDEAELPLSGATVLLADGRQAKTGADGRYTLSGAFPAGAAIVSKPGYATSVIAHLDEPVPLHLRRADGRGELFIQRRRTVTGVARPVAGRLAGGAVHYLDSLDSASEPSPLAPETGAFSVRVTAARSGEPTAVVLIVAKDEAGNTLLGVSRPFSAFSGEPGEIPLHVADRPITYAVTDQPARLQRLQSRLEVHQPGAPAVVLEDFRRAATGTFMAPAAGALPGTLRVVVEARDHDRLATSLVSLAADSGHVAGAFLEPPAPTLDAASGRLAWPEVPGATGYRSAVRRPEYLIAPAWEAWTGLATEITLPEAIRPAAAAGEVVVEAVDAPDLTTRHVASVGPRALRIAPWGAATAYRLAMRRLVGH